MVDRITNLIAAMTLEEKASFCSGLDAWRTKPIDRLGIPSVMMSDGPHGLRKQKGDSPAPNEATVPATCFPTGAALAATWDRDLVARVGIAIAEEAQTEGVGIVLGPAVNVKRSPLCGRNFEYLSEDPYLIGELAKAYIRAVQEQGVGVSLKHFAANNQETRRMLIDTIVDERTLREIYLAGFETAVRESRPWTVMCAYNRLNGTYCSEHPWLLTEVLREQWGYDGIVISDWGAVNDRVAAVAAGLELEMPGSGGVTDADIVAAVRSGQLGESVLDRAIERLLTMVYRAIDGYRAGTTFDAAAHQALAREAAGASAVLLKNEGGMLPLAREGTIAFAGAFAREPRYQGGGSSHVNPSAMTCAYDEAVRLVGDRAMITYAPGYSRATAKVDTGLIEAARGVAAAADVAVVFVGLTDADESEGYDRASLDIPPSHLALLDAILAVQPRVVVVLSNGSPIAMPWLGRVPTVLEGYLGGQAGGAGLVDVLFGAVNPSGKLAETFPVRLEDTPAYLDFPGDATRVVYNERLYVGYRYYDARHLEPLFPFGHGLSYTTFAYSDLAVDRDRLDDTGTVRVAVKVTNTGPVAGAEVVQLYVRDVEASVLRPPKELKGFEKVRLAPGEARTIDFRLGKRAFAFWDEARGDWRVETGTFEILVGASSRDIRLRDIITVKSTTEVSKPFGWNSTLSEIGGRWIGAQVLAAVKRALEAALGSRDGDTSQARMVESVLSEMPLRNLVASSSGRFSRENGQLLLDVMNGKRNALALLKLLKQLL
ncbi:MAG: glycoside hydrolase family 3 C-terminal domain-containing protein [Anaerolineae bacterium]|jgi:beta-glucosidase|nr:glycoside hydrolase family 3 C-terminal domain-containing protein [Anaerolineae bacterium]